MNEPDDLDVLIRELESTPEGKAAMEKARLWARENKDAIVEAFLHAERFSIVETEQGVAIDHPEPSYRKP